MGENHQWVFHGLLRLNGMSLAPRVSFRAAPERAFSCSPAAADTPSDCVGGVAVNPGQELIICLVDAGTPTRGGTNPTDVRPICALLPKRPAAVSRIALDARVIVRHVIGIMIGVS